jgi:hypothetical protein
MRRMLLVVLSLTLVSILRYNWDANILHMKGEMDSEPS